MPRSQIETLYTGRHLSLQRRGDWEFVSRSQGSGVVAIVAVTKNNEFVLTEQFRPPVQMKVVDLPAGIAGDLAGCDEESFVEAAQRELREETGFAGKDLQFIFSGPTSAGLTSEMVDFYLTYDAVQIEAGGGDESEEIKVHLVPLKKIRAWIQRKQTTRTCIDPKVFAALGVLSLNTSFPA